MSVKVKGQWYSLGLTVDDTTGLALTVDRLSGEDAVTLEEWMGSIADAFKTAADDLGLDYQVCKSHVRRNTESLIENPEPAVATDADGSLAAAGVIPEQASRPEAAEQIDISWRPEDVDELETMHYRYLTASPLDGTNNGGERAIGWWVEERYRTMRRYKRQVGGQCQPLAGVVWQSPELR